MKTTHKWFIFSALLGVGFFITGLAVAGRVVLEQVELEQFNQLQNLKLAVLTLCLVTLFSVFFVAGLVIWRVIPSLNQLTKAPRTTPESTIDNEKPYASPDNSAVQELFYSAAFNQAAVGIAQVGVNGLWIEVNQSLCDIIGYDKEELLQTNFQALTHPDDLKKDLNLLKKVLSDDIKTYTMDKRFYKKDDSIVWVNLSVSLVRDDKNNPKYFISIVENITDRKNFEEELEKSKQQKGELIRGRELASEAGGITNWSWDLVTNDLYWDEMMYEIYGIDKKRTNLDYDTWRGQVHPDDIDSAEINLKNTLERLIPFSAVFRIYNKRSGAIRWIKAAADVVCENGKPIKMFGVNLDITDERLAQQALEKEGLLARQANEAKSNFLATMSHEIRTPMNGVIGMIGLLKETSLSQEQERMTNTIRESALSLLEIINGILDFSKIESGKMELDLASVSLSAIVERSVESLWGHAISQNVKVYLIPDLQIPGRIMMDPVRVRQIIINVLGNAIKFSHGLNKQGVVIIRTSLLCTLERKLSVAIEVIDNGVGMTESQKSKLFHPFTQADSSTTRKYGGTGLGLSITKSYVDMMNGYIEVESQLNKGSVFQVVIPIEPDDKQDPELSNVEFTKIKAFVALTDENLSRVACNILDQLGCAYFKFDDFDSVTSIGSYIGQKIDMVIVDRESTANKFIAMSGVKTSEGPRFLLLNEELSSGQSGIKGNMYVASAQPLKPTEFAYALSILSESNSQIYEWLKKTRNARGSTYSQPGKQAEENNPQILVAEDQPTNREVIGLQLATLGYDYEMASDGVEALEKWSSGRFKILLTDCHMPNMDGFELTSEIRRKEELLGLQERTTIIAITANALVGEANHCLKSGMDDYLSKPVELNKLGKSLSIWVTRQNVLSDKSITPELFIDTKVKTISELSESQSNSPVDYDNLVNILGTNDETVIQSILSSFWDSLEKYYDEVLKAIENRDHELLRQSAHAAKGASNSSAILSLGQIFKELELSANEKNWNEINRIQPRLKQEVERVDSFLTEEKKFNVSKNSVKH